MTTQTINPPKTAASLEVEYDRPAGLIRVRGVGIWSPEMVRTYFARLTTLVADHRRTSPAVHVLADLREAGVQTAPIAATIEASTTAIFTKDDVIAQVVNSSLLKMQINRTVHNAVVKAFISPTAAESWLRSGTTA